MRFLSYRDQKVTRVFWEVMEIGATLGHRDKTAHLENVEMLDQRVHQEKLEMTGNL